MERFILLLLLGLSLSARSATFHVGPNGDDGNSGLTPEDAWASLQHAAELAVAGDSVLVQPGAYQGFAAMDHSGTAQAPIVFIAPSGGVVITSPCAYNGQDGINVENVEWVVVEGVEVVPEFAVSLTVFTCLATQVSDVTACAKVLPLQTVNTAGAAKVPRRSRRRAWVFASVAGTCGFIGNLTRSFGTASKHRA